MKKTIDLTRPIPGHGGLVKRLTLREPSFGELAEFGDPVDYGFTKNAEVSYRMINNIVVKKYLCVCLETLPGEPTLDNILLEALSLGDALLIRNELLSFFSLPSASADGKLE